MKFIVDAQLPPDLADWIASRGHEAAHVYHLGFADEPDGAIWKTALASGAIVLTKDRAFVEWAGVRRPAPQVVWVRIGNVGNASLTVRIEAVWDRVVADLSAGAQVVKIGRE